MDTFSFKDQYCHSYLSLKMNLKGTKTDAFNKQADFGGGLPALASWNSCLSVVPSLEWGQDL